MHLRLRSEGLSWRTIDDEVIAVDFRDSRYLSANTAGMVLWELLAQGAEVDALVDALVSRFGIAAARARADVDAFVEQLEARSLLEPAAVGA